MRQKGKFRGISPVAAALAAVTLFVFTFSAFPAPAVAADTTVDFRQTEVSDFGSEPDWSHVRFGENLTLNSYSYANGNLMVSLRHRPALDDYSDEYYILAMAPEDLPADSGDWVSAGMKLSDILSGLGIDPGLLAVPYGITGSDGTYFVTYEVMDNIPEPNNPDNTYVGTAKMGILSTTDGKTWKAIDLPFSFVNHWSEDTDIVAPYKLTIWNGNYIVTCDPSYNVPPATQREYYTSTDLEHWTKRLSPDFSEYKGYIDSDITFRLEFNLVLRTENGVYFEARVPNGHEITDKKWIAELGIFYTEDFENYTRVTPETEDSYRKFYRLYPSDITLSEDTVAIITGPQWETTEILDVPVSVLLYDENTKELTEILTVKDELDPGLVYYAGTNPVELIMESAEDDSGLTYFVSRDEPREIHKRQSNLGLEDELNYASLVDGRRIDFVKTAGKNYSFQIDAYQLSGGSVKFVLSEGYFDKAYVLSVDKETLGINDPIVEWGQKLIFQGGEENAPEQMVFLHDGGYAVCGMADLVAPLTPVEPVKDEEAGVEVFPTTPDAVPEGAALSVKKTDEGENATVYDIALKAGDETVQPRYPVYVTLPVPADRESYSFRVFRREADGGETELRAKKMGGKIAFETDHFSVYTIRWAAPDHEHKFGEWTADANGHKRSCECGETEEGSHTYGEWTVTKEPTATETGSRSRSCSVCGYTETEEMAAQSEAEQPGGGTGSGNTGEPGDSGNSGSEEQSPATGDGKFYLWLALLVTSGAGILCLTFGRKKSA